MDLLKKTAIITGAGRGIGKDIALALSKEGCNIVLVSRTLSQLEKVRNEIKQSGGTAIPVVADLSRGKDIQKIIDETLKNFSTIDILINNAAVLFSGPFMEISEEQWDQSMQVNLKAAFLLGRMSFEIMKEKRCGYIINISSTAALCVPPGIAAYGISKMGMTGLAQALYETAKEFNVKVSTIYPGMTDTEMLRSFKPPVDPEKWMMPEDITGCILFLLKQSDRVIIKELIPWAAKHDKI